ncbi:MAG: hypothetical protein Q9P01_08440 [Anaerolineae bacterium]|nr:hypothetical protein [Anaerolineae bacterium]MDQ7034850.1 hypothetical protein [Anaerolineae bacterium]
MSYIIKQPLEKVMLMRPFLLLILLIFLIFPVFAQDDVEPITAENVHRLQRIAQIDFETLDCEFGTGWFVISTNGDYLAALDNQNHVYLWTIAGDLLRADDTACDDLRYTTQLAFDNNDYLYTFEQVDDALIVSRQHPLDLTGLEAVLILPDILLLSTWLDETSGLWMEVRVNDSEAIISVADVFIASNEFDILPYVVANDIDAIVRIGRIPPPYTVTSSRDGIVKLWNIQTGDTVYEVDNGTGEAAVFGAINSEATHLVWRDSRNESLYLLNFETGENQYLAGLAGQYAQWYFLSPDASVALAVNLGFEPSIVAWDIATGEQAILGDYRECSRPQPDMTRLSADGTTLVIGCDTGLDIWRIVPENE